MIAIIDYGMGNLRSVQKAFEKNGAKAVVTSSARDIDRAEKIVLPGVGAFGGAMEELKRRDLVDMIKEKIADGIPYLGLCLGLQLLFDTSEESAEGETVKGLGIVPGIVRRFRGKFKIPHMGWNSLRLRKKNCPLFKGIASGENFYFVHSFYGIPKDPSWTVATTPYGPEFCSAIWKGNIFATQFHPEKSQMAGLRVIKNFINV